MKNLLMCISLIFSIFVPQSYGSNLHDQTLKIQDPCRIGIEAVKVSPDSSYLAVVCYDDYRSLHTAAYTLVVYDLKGLKELSRTEFHEESVFVAPNFYPEFTPDSSELIVFTDNQREIRLNKISMFPPYDLERNNLKFEGVALKGVVTSNHIAENGTIYFGLGRYGEGPSLYSVNPLDFSIEKIFADKPSSARGEDVKAISSTDDLVVSLSQDNYLRIYERQQPNYGQKVLLSSKSSPYDVGNKAGLVYVGAGQNLSEHDILNGKELSSSSYASSGPSKLLPRPNANLFLVLGKNSTIQIRSLNTKSLLLDTANLAEYSGLYLPYVPVMDLAENGRVLAVKFKDSLLVSYLN
ncbi:MAG: hypothetical protein AB8G05_23465 [Oligoflexales bacterium]